VLTAVVMKSSVFWDITLCSPLKVNRCFVGIYCLHLQGRRVRQARKQCEAGSKLSLFIPTHEIDLLSLTRLIKSEYNMDEFISTFCAITSS
jgi:hypothetical protein